MQKTLASRSFLIVLGGALLLICAASRLSAQSYIASETYSAGIDLGQGGATGYGYSQTLLNNDCAPVATANGLSYLYGVDPGAFNNSPQDNYGTVHSLVTDMGTTDAAGNAGTTQSGAITGLGTYLTANRDSITSTQIPYPTGLTLANALNAGDAVQLGIVWGSTVFDPNADIYTANSGGHFVSLTGINSYDSYWSAATMTVLDPWGVPAQSNPNAGTTATSTTWVIYTENLNGTSQQVLDVNYTSAYSPYDNSGSGDQTGPNSFGIFGYGEGYVAFADIESVAVPEPTTMSLLLAPLGAGLLRMLRKNRTA
jgi:hypothetical protein